MKHLITLAAAATLAGSMTLQARDRYLEDRERERERERALTVRHRADPVTKRKRKAVKAARRINRRKK